MKDITAVVVTYNRKELLIRCINSLRKQTVRLNDIIVVNNGSTDGTKEWYSFFLKEEPSNKMDKIYRKMALRSFDRFFSYKREQTLWETLNSGISNSILCLKKSNDYELSKIHICRVLCRVLKEKIKSIF
jgi:GT2 family glycosyltransferase